MSEPRGMVIVGAGHAGGRAAHALRDAGWKGAVTLVGTEPHPPYERPPLSKGLLTGEKTLADFALYEAEAWQRQDIRHIASATVAEIRREPREVLLHRRPGHSLRALLLATGAEPRRLPLPGAALPGVVVLRDLAESEALRAGSCPATGWW
jgi:3-phenylpropionate/trans-cinnamate dioxygenase ferredoxin reductase subunit